MILWWSGRTVSWLNLANWTFSITVENFNEASHWKLLISDIRPRQLFYRSRGTLMCRGTQVGKHWFRQSKTSFLGQVHVFCGIPLLRLCQQGYICIFTIKTILIDWLNFVIFYVFATQQRFLSPVQLIVDNELFHQSSFYFKKILFYHSSFYFNNVICIFLREENSGEISGGIFPRPLLADTVAYHCSGLPLCPSLCPILPLRPVLPSISFGSV